MQQDKSRNTSVRRRPSQLLQGIDDRRVYFVNSFRATPSAANEEWTLATSHYGGDFVSVVGKGDVYATQFHPEKSGGAGLDILRNFLGPREAPADQPPAQQSGESPCCRLASRHLIQPECLELLALW